MGYRAVAVALCCLMSGVGDTQAQPVFVEDFNPGSAPGCDLSAGVGNLPFPTGWLLRNVDALTPTSETAFVNDAWEVREAFGDDPSNCVAFSTSDYDPPGAANDWMWTPLINVPAGVSLFWRARSYDAARLNSYQVRVMTAAMGPPSGGTGDLGNQLANSTVLAEVNPESARWTTRRASLAAYAGQSIYIGFWTRTPFRYLLAIDDVQVTADVFNLEANGPVEPSRWSRVPDGVPVVPRLGAMVINTSGAAAPAPSITATLLRDDEEFGPPVASNPVGAIAPGASAFATWPAPGGAPLSAGKYNVRYEITVQPGEQDSFDNVTLSQYVQVGGRELARYDGSEFVVPIGISATNSGGEIATVLDVPAPMTILGVRLVMEGRDPPPDGEPDRWTGRPIVARIRAADSNGVPLEPILAETLPVGGSRLRQDYDLQLATPLDLPAGRYAVSAVEPANSEGLSLAANGGLYEANLNRVYREPDLLWARLESIGPQFALTPQLGLLVGLPLLKDGFEPAAPAAKTSPDAVPPAPLPHRLLMPARVIDVPPR